MELHGPDAAVWIFDAGEGVGGNSNAAETGRKLEGFVAVAHPHLEGFGQLGEDGRGCVLDYDVGVTVLAQWRGANLAAKMMHDELEAIADAKDGCAEFEDARVGGRGVGVIDRRGAAGEDDADGLV